MPLPVSEPVVWSRESKGPDVDPFWGHYDFGSFFSVTILPPGNFEHRFYYDEVHVLAVDGLPYPMRMAWNSDRVVEGFGGVDHVTRYPATSDVYIQAEHMGGGLVLSVDADWVERRVPDVSGEMQCSVVPNVTREARRLVTSLLRGEADPLAVDAFVDRLVEEAWLGPARNLTQPNGLSVEILGRVESFVRESEPRDVSVSSMADVAGLSYFTFTRRFRRAIGMTPHQYILCHRLMRARALLLHTARPLAEVALCAGFANQAHLTSVYRARFGTTPGRCRAKVRHVQAPASRAGTAGQPSAR